MEIASLPTAADTEGFWDGLLCFSAEHRVTHIEANSYASPPMVIPALKHETERRDRYEYVLDLRGFSVDRMSTNHRRAIRKAKSNDLVIRRGVDRDACREHVRLMNLSANRRRQRGEVISGVPVTDEFLAFLECGCGELFQAVTATTVLSSALILRSARGAYYQSAGTAPEGMDLGASHFLISGIASRLQQEGLTTFNLGGAPSESSLARFKSSFGATVVPLTSVSLYVAQAWRRKLIYMKTAWDSVNSAIRSRIRPQDVA
jgi:lipid II:glycine glycyltransferase (peptidoglycan interpeptide bridge formation enzyme)